MAETVLDREALVPAVEPAAPGRLARIIRRAPVSSMLMAPYLLLFIPMAVLHQNPHTGFLVKVIAMAAVPTAIFEWSVRATRRAPSAQRYCAGPELARLAKVVCTVGFVSILLGTLLGSGTITDQASGVSTASSPLVALTNLFVPWQYLGLGLILASRAAGQLGRGSVMRWFALGFAANVLKFALSTISAPMFTYMITAAFLLIYCGILRTRHVVVGMIVVMALWPTIHTARDQARASIGAAGTSASAGERLRYDLQITRAADITPPLDIGQPGAGEILRYGLVPRVIDQGRGVISTGVLIASYLAGGRTPWAYTFLPVTSLYVFEGGIHLALFYIAMAALLLVALGNGTRQTPWSMMLLALVLSGPLGWFATFPDSTIGALQGLVAAVPIGFMLVVSRSRGRDAGRGGHAAQ